MQGCLRLVVEVYKKMQRVAQTSVCVTTKELKLKEILDPIITD